VGQSGQSRQSGQSGLVELVAVGAVVDGLGTRVLFGSIVQGLDFRRAREAVGLDEDSGQSVCLDLVDGLGSRTDSSNAYSVG